MPQSLDQPLYRKVQDQLVGAILRGSMPAGSRLPSLRRLAKDLGVSRITVDAAYEAPEAQGFVEARARSGTYVTRLGAPPAPPQGGMPYSMERRNSSLCGMASSCPAAHAVTYSSTSRRWSDSKRSRGADWGARSKQVRCAA